MSQFASFPNDILFEICKYLNSLNDFINFAQINKYNYENLLLGDNISFQDIFKNIYFKLTKLYLFNCNLGNNVLNLQQLNVLLLNNCNFTDDNINELKNLTELNIEYLVNNEFIGCSLQNFSKLKTLKLTYTNVQDEHLINLQNLEKLYLTGNRITGICFENLKQLQNLYVFGCNKKIVRYQDYLHHLINLTSLSVKCSSTINNFSFLNKLVNLTKLTIYSKFYKDVDFYELRKLKYLTILEGKISGECFKYLNSLQFLKCDLNKITNLEYLKNINSIKSKSNLKTKNIKEEDLQDLCLTYLNLSYPNNNSIINGSCLLKLQNLTFLNISGSLIEDKYLQNLKQLKQLECTECCNITGECLLYLTNLEILNINNSSNNFSSKTELKDKYFVNLKKLKILNVNSTKSITGECLLYVTNLEILNIQFNQNVKDEYFNNLICLKELNIYGCNKIKEYLHIGKTKVKDEHLQNLKNLKELYAKNCHYLITGTFLLNMNKLRIFYLSHPYNDKIKEIRERIREGEFFKEILQSYTFVVGGNGERRMTRYDI
ncbi:hypothetical protein ABK040_002359 [Willaertia magna]